MDKPIEVVAIHPLTDWGNLRALVTVCISGLLVIHDWRVMQVPGHLAYVEAPKRSYFEDNEGRFSGPLVEFPKEMESDIARAILEAWGVSFGLESD